jgi:hypothetical protein
MDTRKKGNGQHRKLGTISRNDLPAGRKGKHHSMLIDVLEALQQLDERHAIKVPLAEYTGSVADIRAAVHRATKKQNLQIATSSDEEYFYVWKAGLNSAE